MTDDLLFTALLFRRAMELAASGEPDLLAGMVREDNPHSEYARGRLASFIAVRPRRRRGRKADPDVIDAAEEVEMFKRELRAAGWKIYNFRDPDKKDPNKKSHDDIVEFVFERRAEKGWPNPEREALNHYLKRPRNSRAKKSV